MKSLCSCFTYHEDQKNKLKIPRDIYLTLLSSVGSISSFIQGYTLTLSGIMILNEHFLNEVSNGRNSSKFSDEFLYLFYGGSIIGSLFSYIFSDSFGRKNTLLVVTVLCIMTLLWSSMSTTGANLLIMRFCLGCIISILVTTSAVYISEISTPNERGKSLSLMNIYEVSGSIICGLFYYSFYNEFEAGWRVDISAPIVVLIFLIFVLFVIPESPRWTLAHKTPSECLVSLRQLRRTNDISREFNVIYKALTYDARLGDSWYDIWMNRSIRYRLRLCALLQLTQHFVGLPAITIFAGAVLAQVGVKWIDLTLVLVYLSAWIGSVLGYYKVDNWGRRFLVISGYALLSVLWLFAACVVQLGNLDNVGNLSQNSSTHSYFPSGSITNSSTSTSITNSSNVSTRSLFVNMNLNIVSKDINTNSNSFNDYIIPLFTILSLFQKHTSSLYGSTLISIQNLFSYFSMDFYGMFSFTVCENMVECQYIFRNIFIILFSMIAFIYSFTLGSTMTVISAEIFPLRARMKSTGLALSCHMISAASSAIFMKLYMLVIPSVRRLSDTEDDENDIFIINRLAQCMIIFAIISLTTCAFVYIMLPETKGLMLEDMEELFDLNYVNNNNNSNVSSSSNGLGTVGVGIGNNNSNNENSISAGSSNSNSSNSTSQPSLSYNNNHNNILAVIYYTCNTLYQWCLTFFQRIRYYCFCCCPASFPTRSVDNKWGLMGFRTVTTRVPLNISTTHSANTSTNNTNNNQNNIINDDINNNNNNNILLFGHLGGLGRHVLLPSSLTKAQEEILYNPATLHKYSGEMRESTFLLFDENESFPSYTYPHSSLDDYAYRSKYANIENNNNTSSDSSNSSSHSNSNKYGFKKLVIQGLNPLPVDSLLSSPIHDSSDMLLPNPVQSTYIPRMQNRSNTRNREDDITSGSRLDNYNNMINSNYNNTNILKNKNNSSPIRMNRTYGNQPISLIPDI